MAKNTLSLEIRISTQSNNDTIFMDVDPENQVYELLEQLKIQYNVKDKKYDLFLIQDRSSLFKRHQLIRKSSFDDQEIASGSLLEFSTGFQPFEVIFPDGSENMISLPTNEPVMVCIRQICLNSNLNFNDQYILHLENETPLCFSSSFEMQGVTTNDRLFLNFSRLDNLNSEDFKDQNYLNLVYSAHENKVLSDSLLVPDPLAIQLAAISFFVKKEHCQGKSNLESILNEEMLENILPRSICLFKENGKSEKAKVKKVRTEIIEQLKSLQGSKDILMMKYIQLCQSSEWYGSYFYDFLRRDGGRMENFFAGIHKSCLIIIDRSDTKDENSIINQLVNKDSSLKVNVGNSGRILTIPLNKITDFHLVDFYISITIENQEHPLTFFSSNSIPFWFSLLKNFNGSVVDATFTINGITPLPVFLQLELLKGQNSSIREMRSSYDDKMNKLLKQVSRELDSSDNDGLDSNLKTSKSSLYAIKCTRKLFSDIHKLLEKIRVEKNDSKCKLLSVSHLRNQFYSCYSRLYFEVQQLESILMDTRHFSINMNRIALVLLNLVDFLFLKKKRTNRIKGNNFSNLQKLVKEFVFLGLTIENIKYKKAQKGFKSGSISVRNGETNSSNTDAVISNNVASSVSSTTTDNNKPINNEEDIGTENSEIHDQHNSDNKDNNMNEPKYAEKRDIEFNGTIGSCKNILAKIRDIIISILLEIQTSKIGFPANNLSLNILYQLDILLNVWDSSLNSFWRQIISLVPIEESKTHSIFGHLDSLKNYWKLFKLSSFTKSIQNDNRISYEDKMNMNDHVQDIFLDIDSINSKISQLGQIRDLVESQLKEIKIILASLDHLSVLTSNICEIKTQAKLIQNTISNFTIFCKFYASMKQSPLLILNEKYCAFMHSLKLILEKDLDKMDCNAQRKRSSNLTSYQNNLKLKSFLKVKVLVPLIENLISSAYNYLHNTKRCMECLEYNESREHKGMRSKRSSECRRINKISNNSIPHDDPKVPYPASEILRNKLKDIGRVQSVCLRREPLSAERSLKPSISSVNIMQMRESDMMSKASTVYPNAISDSTSLIETFKSFLDPASPHYLSEMFSDNDSKAKLFDSIPKSDVNPTSSLIKSSVFYNSESFRFCFYEFQRLLSNLSTMNSDCSDLELLSHYKFICQQLRLIGSNIMAHFMIKCREKGLFIDANIFSILYPASEVLLEIVKINLRFGSATNKDLKENEHSIRKCISRMLNKIYEYQSSNLLKLKKISQSVSSVIKNLENYPETDKKMMLCKLDFLDQTLGYYEPILEIYQVLNLKKKIDIGLESINESLKNFSKKENINTSKDNENNNVCSTKVINPARNNLKFSGSRNRILSRSIHSLSASTSSNTLDSNEIPDELLELYFSNLQSMKEISIGLCSSLVNSIPVRDVEDMISRLAKNVKELLSPQAPTERLYCYFRIIGRTVRNLLDKWKKYYSEKRQPSDSWIILKSTIALESLLKSSDDNFDKFDSYKNFKNYYFQNKKYETGVNGYLQIVDCIKKMFEKYIRIENSSTNVDGDFDPAKAVVSLIKLYEEMKSFYYFYKEKDAEEEKNDVSLNSSDYKSFSDSGKDENITISEPRHHGDTKDFSNLFEEYQAIEEMFKFEQITVKSCRVDEPEPVDRFLSTLTNPFKRNIKSEPTIPNLSILTINFAIRMCDLCFNLENRNAFNIDHYACQDLLHCSINIIDCVFNSIYDPPEMRISYDHFQKLTSRIINTLPTPLVIRAFKYYLIKRLNLLEMNSCVITNNYLSPNKKIPELTDDEISSTQSTKLKSSDMIRKPLFNSHEQTEDVISILAGLQQNFGQFWNFSSSQDRNISHKLFLFMDIIQYLSRLVQKAFPSSESNNKYLNIFDELQYGLYELSKSSIPDAKDQLVNLCRLTDLLNEKSFTFQTMLTKNEFDDCLVKLKNFLELSDNKSSSELNHEILRVVFHAHTALIHLRGNVMFRESPTSLTCAIYGLLGSIRNSIEKYSFDPKLQNDIGGNNYNFNENINNGDSKSLEICTLKESVDFQMKVWFMIETISQFFGCSNDPQLNLRTIWIPLLSKIFQYDFSSFERMFKSTNAPSEILINESNMTISTLEMKILESFNGIHELFSSILELTPNEIISTLIHKEVQYNFSQLIHDIVLYLKTTHNVFDKNRIIPSIFGFFIQLYVFLKSLLSSDTAYINHLEKMINLVEKFQIEFKPEYQCDSYLMISNSLKKIRSLQDYKSPTPALSYSNENITGSKSKKETWKNICDSAGGIISSSSLIIQYYTYPKILSTHLEALLSHLSSLEEIARDFTYLKKANKEVYDELNIAQDDVLASYYSLLSSIQGLIKNKNKYKNSSNSSPKESEISPNQFMENEGPIATDGYISSKINSDPGQNSNVLTVNLSRALRSTSRVLEVFHSALVDPFHFFNLDLTGIISNLDGAVLSLESGVHMTGMSLGSDKLNSNESDEITNPFFISMNSFSSDDIHSVSLDPFEEIIRNISFTDNSSIHSNLKSSTHELKCFWEGLLHLLRFSRVIPLAETHSALYLLRRMISSLQKFSTAPGSFTQEQILVKSIFLKEFVKNLQAQIKEMWNLIRGSTERLKIIKNDMNEKIKEIKNVIYNNEHMKVKSDEKLNNNRINDNESNIKNIISKFNSIHHVSSSSPLSRLISYGISTNYFNPPPPSMNSGEFIYDKKYPNNQDNTKRNINIDLNFCIESIVNPYFIMSFISSQIFNSCKVFEESWKRSYSWHSGEPEKYDSQYRDFDAQIRNFASSSIALKELIDLIFILHHIVPELFPRLLKDQERYIQTSEALKLQYKLKKSLKNTYENSLHFLGAIASGEDVMTSFKKICKSLNKVLRYMNFVGCPVLRLDLSLNYNSSHFNDSVPNYWNEILLRDSRAVFLNSANNVIQALKNTRKELCPEVLNQLMNKTNCVSQTTIEILDFIFEFDSSRLSISPQSKTYIDYRTNRNLCIDENKIRTPTQDETENSPESKSNVDLDTNNHTPDESCREEIQSNEIRIIETEDSQEKIENENLVKIEESMSEEEERRGAEDEIEIDSDDRIDQEYHSESRDDSKIEKQVEEPSFQEETLNQTSEHSKDNQKRIGSIFKNIYSIISKKNKAGDKKVFERQELPEKSLKRTLNSSQNSPKSTNVDEIELFDPEKSGKKKSKSNDKQGEVKEDEIESNDDQITKSNTSTISNTENAITSNSDTRNEVLKPSSEENQNLDMDDETQIIHKNNEMEATNMEKENPTKQKHLKNSTQVSSEDPENSHNNSRSLKNSFVSLPKLFVDDNSNSASDSDSEHKKYSISNSSQHNIAEDSRISKSIVPSSIQLFLSLSLLFNQIKECISDLSSFDFIRSCCSLVNSNLIQMRLSIKNTPKSSDILFDQKLDKLSSSMNILVDLTLRTFNEFGFDIQQISTRQGPHKKLGEEMRNRSDEIERRALVLTTEKKLLWHQSRLTQILLQKNAK